MSRTFVVGTGTNLGSRWALQHAAFQRLAATEGLSVVALARPRRTAALVQPGQPPGPDYLNGGLRIEGRLEPEALLDVLLGIERELGRQRSLRWAARTLDLDLLWWDGPPVRTPRLSVPHPGLGARAFARAAVADALGDRAVAAPAAPFARGPELVADGRSRTVIAWDDADALAWGLTVGAPAEPFVALEAESAEGFVAAAGARRAGAAVVFALGPGSVRGAVARAADPAPRWRLAGLEGGRCALRLVE